MKRTLIMVVSLLFAGTALFAQGQPQVLPNDPEVRQGKLENGLTYYIRHNALPEQRAEFYLATNVGAIQETPDQDGLAHFLEHMCFNGTKNFPGKGIIDWLQSIGASFGGNVNASTGFEETQYMLNNIPLVRQSVIDTCILILHDYSHFVINDPKEIDLERPVIIEERRTRRNASWRTFERSLPYYYADSKYATCTLIGSEENLKTFKPESLWNFYKTWYTPDKQAVIVVGDVDVDYVENVIKKTFADIPAAENPAEKAYIKVPGCAEPRIGIITDPETTSTSIEMLWLSEAMPEIYNSTIIGEVTDIMKDVISQVMAERFEDITAKPDAPFLSGSFGIGNLCETSEASMAEVRLSPDNVLGGFEAYYTEIEKMRRFGLGDAEVERAKSNILSYYESAAKKAETRKNPEFVRPLIQNFFDSYAYMDPNTEYELVQQIMPMINAQAVNQAAQTCITDSNLVVIYSAPEKAGLSHPTQKEILDVINKVKASDIQANAEEAVVTELLDPASLKGAKVKKTADAIYGAKEIVLKNGVTVLLYPSEREKDRISFSLEKKGGLSILPVEDMPSFDENIMSLFSRNQGVSKFSSTDITKALSGKNVTVGPYISELFHGISGTSTVKDLETAFQLMYLYFTDPRFDQNEYDTAIKSLNAILPNFMGTPTYPLYKALYQTAYGDNPRKQFVSPEIVAKANLQTIEKDYRKLFSDAAGAVAIIVGDFKVDEITPLVVKYFGSLPKGKKASDWVDPKTDVLPGVRSNVFSTDMETPMTTVIDIYTADAKYSEKLRAALNAVEYILNMRYVTSLREDAGGTYGASVSTSLDRIPSPKAELQISFNSKPASADHLRELAAKGFKELAEQGPTDSEFDMTVKNLQKNIPESRQRNSYWSSVIRSNYYYGEDRDQAWEAAVNALTADDIKAAAALVYGSGNFVEIVQRPGTTSEKE